ncbi:hypothetical protein [Vacuolonema iberomarrocanum]|uniref:hypothetical protein n=1 Tax=Vacuolonema iberomarrocanum TaxID=3454632 RepID=UPI0019FC0D16|nr:hypothetical protein [filamentous cyanobacterium LEGE 07170]
MSYRKHQTPLEHRRVLQLAREYRQQGFDVTIYPASEDLPTELAQCPLDLVAKGEDKVIAIEVRTRENLTLNGSEDLRRMAGKIESLPKWDFQLVVTNPRRPQAS